MALFAALGLFGAVGAAPASALGCTDASLFSMPPANAPLPGSCFEGYDGNQVDPDGATSAPPAAPNRIDWQSAIGTSGFASAPDYVVGSRDSQFGPGGSEEAPDSWTFNIGSIGSDKYDATAGWTFREPDTTDLFLALAFIRASNNGETHLAFELNQRQPGYRAATESGTGGRVIKVPTRSTGDLLITYSVSNNAGTAPRLGLCKWSGDEHAGHWQDFAGVNVGDQCPALLPAVAQASMNPTNITGADNSLQPGTALQAGRFGEAVINLSEALKAAGGDPTQPDPCVSFGYMWLHSRSSPSITSNQQDYILPSDAINVANCAVSGKKFHDVDGDGLPQEGGEPGLGGWTIFADYDNDGALDNDKVAPFVNDGDGVVEAGEEEPYDVTAGAGDLRPVGSYTITNIQNGTWTIREAGQAGWSCTFPDPCGHQVVMTGKLVENINFGNNQPGKVRVVKSTDPDGDSTEFDFDPSANLSAENFTRRDNQAAQEFTVRAGTYTVSELAEAGWDLASIDCSDGDSGGSGATATFNVAASETVTCTFRNVKRGEVRVVKSTDPDGDPTEFDFDPSAGLAADDFTRADNEAAKAFSVAPGSYEVAELAEYGWDLGSIECSDEDSTGDGNVATFNVAAGEVVTCTFHNVKRGTIEIEKQTDPDEPGASATSFGFTGSGALAANSNLEPASFELIDDGVKTIGNVKPNNGGDAYDVTEETKVGYRLAGIDCGHDGDSGGSTENRTANIHVSPGETVRCTFTNTKLHSGTLVVKQGTLQAHHGDPLTFTFDVTNTGNSPLHDVHVTDDHCAPVSDTPIQNLNDNGDALLEFGEHWVFTCTYTAPAEHHDDEEDPIHNTATASAFDEQNQPVSDTDEHDTDLLHPDIVVDKKVRVLNTGEFVDAGLKAHVGDTLEYRFEVTDGASDTPIENVGLSDPRCDAGTLSAPVKSGGNANELLENGETWTYTCTHVITEQDPNPLPNTVRAVGHDKLGGRVEDQDSTSVAILKPGTLVVKEGNQLAYPGDTVTFTFAVTNEGNAPLSDVAVTDDRCAPVTGPVEKQNDDGDALLEPGEKWIFTCSKQIPAGHKIGDENPIRNVATATGTDELGKTVTSTDDHRVQVLHPAIDIEKTGPATAVAGTALGYALTVTNPGDVPFAAQQVVVTDPRCEAPPAGPSTGADQTPGQLDPGDKWTYTCTAQTTGQPAGTFVNTATVTAKDFNGREVSDRDEFPTVLEVQQVLPQPEIVKGTARARLRGPSGCVRKPFHVTVRGSRIARVTFFRDGKRIKRIKAKPGQRRFTLRVKPSERPGVHRITARIEFVTASRTRARTLRLSYQACVRQIVRPRFTG